MVVVCGVMSHKPPCPGINSIGKNIFTKLSSLAKSRTDAEDVVSASSVSEQKKKTTTILKKQKIKKKKISTKKRPYETKKDKKIRIKYESLDESKSKKKKETTCAFCENKVHNGYNFVACSYECLKKNTTNKERWKKHNNPRKCNRKEIKKIEKKNGDELTKFVIKHGIQNIDAFINFIEERIKVDEIEVYTGARARNSGCPYPRVSRSYLRGCTKKYLENEHQCVKLYEILNHKNHKIKCEEEDEIVYIETDLPEVPRLSTIILEERQIQEVIEKEPTRGYIKFATNNLQDILKDTNGCRCVYCLGKPNVTIDSDVCDKSTVICELCGIDAVVPISKIQEPIEETLAKWHEHGFGDI